MTLVKDNFGLRQGGWIPDIPDQRDYTLRNCIRVLRKAVSESNGLDSSSDLRDFFPSVEDQGVTLATTAFSCGSLVEYFNRRCRGKLLTVSKPFLYDVSRRMHGVQGDCGASIRQVLKTLVRVGVPPEVCSHEIAVRAGELSLDPLMYAFARDYRKIQYYRVGSFGKQDSLQVVKSLLSLGLPCVFGMPLYTSVSSDPRIDCRPTTDEVIGGVSGVLVGYDDDFRISTCGALRFRSSWGVDWGESGYGWISYKMLEAGLVRDIWTIFSPDWSKNGDFSFGE